MANFKKNSRYTNGTSFKNRSGKDFLILRSSLNLAQDAGDVLVTVTQDIIQRPDLIASKAYGDPSLWWVIYEFNNIKDPLFELKIGQVLRIPDINRVLKAIKSINT